MINETGKLRSALLALCASAAFGVSLAGPAASQQPSSRAWPHESSDLAADPMVRFGVLPNGMRYAIRPNRLPVGEVQLRLIFEAGSNNETAEELGLAHFLEHMAFAGTKNVPEDELMRMLERLGSRKGADTNAMTGLANTIYMFNLPRSDSESLDTGFKLMREIASEITLAPDAVDRERGVVLSEERARYTAATPGQEQQIEAVFADAVKLPIGKIAIIEKAQASTLRAFYDKWYRPERATLLVVGDITQDAIEQRIKITFGDWKGRGPNPSSPALPNVTPELGKIQIRAETTAIPMAAVNWFQPAVREKASVARSRKAIIDNLAMAVFNQRMAQAAQQPNPPFIGGGASTSSSAAFGRQASLSVSATKNVLGALETAEKMRLQAVRYGFNQSELDQVIATERRALERLAATVNNRVTTPLTQLYLSKIASYDPPRHSGQELELFNQVTGSLKLEEVNVAFRAALTDDYSLLFLTDKTAPAGGEAAVRDVLTKVRASTIENVTVAETKAWPYTDFGTPGRVVERREDAGLGITFVKFENGVRLVMKKSAFPQPTLTQVRVMFGRGQLDLPKDKFSPAGMWGSVLTQGGLNKVTPEEQRRQLAGKTASVLPSIAEGGFILTGQTRAADLKLQMQMLAAYMTDATWNPKNLQTSFEMMDVIRPLMDTDPHAVFSQNVGLLLRNGDHRFGVPAPEQQKAFTPEQVKALMQPIMSTSDMEVVIVSGDVPVDTMIAETAATLGALPPRKPVAEPPGARDLRFASPTPTPIVFKHKGRADQGLAYIAWPADGHYKDIDAIGHARIMHMILMDRMNTEIREKQGKAYGVGGTVFLSKTFHDYGSVTLEAPVAATDMTAFFQTVERIVTDLRTNLVSQDEIDRALRPRKVELQRSAYTNAYWANNMLGVERDPRRLEDLRVGARSLDMVTPESVRAAAQKWLVMDKAWKATVVPE